MAKNVPKQKVTVSNKFTKDWFGIFRDIWRCANMLDILAPLPPASCSTLWMLTSHLTRISVPSLLSHYSSPTSTTIGSSGKYHSRVFWLVRLKRVCLLDVGAELELILAIPHVRAPPWLLPLVVRIHKLQKKLRVRFLPWVPECVRGLPVTISLGMGGVDHVGAVKASSKMPGSSIQA